MTKSIKKSKVQKWGLISDLHCGSSTGLGFPFDNPVRVQLDDRWKTAVKWLGPVDVLLVNGDEIDGEDRKGRDVVTDDCEKQADEAANYIAMIKPKKEIIIISGTPYHTEKAGQAFRKVLAHKLHLLLGEKIKITFKRKLKTTINGWFRLEARHKIGSSTVPHGRHTAPNRSKTWNTINACLSSGYSGKAAKWPHLCVFGHVHYYTFSKDAFGAVCTLPCWQAIGSRFGDEQCDGHVDLGMARLTVKGVNEWQLDEILFPAGVVDRWENR